MSKAADRLGASASFSNARPVSARRAAIAAATEAPTAGTGLLTTPELRLDAISHNPDNPRERIGEITELADTLREIGLIQAITVVTVDAYLAERPARTGELEPGTEYVVVDGHRRLAAAREAGFETIRYTLNNAFAASDEALLEAAFIANFKREDLSDLEEATALKKLVEHYGSQRKAAQRLGTTQAFISQRLSLLSLDPELQADLEAGRRTVQHVRGLGKMPADEQRRAADDRAEQDREAAEAKRRQREDRQRAMVPASRQSEPSAEPSGTHSGVTGADTTPEAQSDVGSGDNAVITVQGDVPRAPGGAALPWHDASEVLRLMRMHMTPSDLEWLARELLEVPGA